jgi:hypothetical protein
MANSVLGDVEVSVSARQGKAADVIEIDHYKNEYVQFTISV